MVSFQAEDMMIRRKTSTIPEFENSSKKRKLEDDEETNFEKRQKAESKRSVFDMELHLETPLPFEWQRCLDIQSGQIHFYNTKTDMRTSKDPRKSPDQPPSPAAGHMSVDLELNLTRDSTEGYSTTRGGSVDIMKINSSRQSLSWLGVEEKDDEQEEEQEMIATVCMRCHMLVMLCKTSPACPNCKFMHPPDQGPLKLFKQSLSLLF